MSLVIVRQKDFLSDTFCIVVCKGRRFNNSFRVGGIFGGGMRRKFLSRCRARTDGLIVPSDIERDWRTILS